MVSLPDSIGNLKALTELDLGNCESLKSLPDSIKDLTSLTNLNLSQCYKLKSLPDGFGELKALVSLNILNMPVQDSMPWDLKRQLEAQGCIIEGYRGRW